MLDRLPGGVAVVADGGADAGKFAGGDRDAGAAAADDDAAIDLAVADGGGDRLGDVGVVDGGAGMGAEIEDFVSLLGQAPARSRFISNPAWSAPTATRI